MITRLFSLHDAIFAWVETKFSGVVLPTLARFTFAATLLIYFWNSAATKIGDGFFGFLSLSNGAYFQIFPKAIEAAGYDTSALTPIHTLIALAGTWGEFILPALVVFGLFTRIASIGMIGFIAIQSLTDLYGHGGIEHEGTLGAWFDRLSDSLILDQRLFWVTILVVLIVKGAGPLSIDRIIGRR